jgi:tetratricopeptide (TPR) repeat protein
MLAASRGTFSLSVAVCNSPALRDYVIDQLRAADGGIQTVRLPKDTADVLAVVREAVKGASPPAIFIMGMEQSLPSTAKEHPVLRHLNGTREAWKATYSCPVVFWVPEYAVRLVMTEARDFWAWRSHQFEFVAETATVKAGMTDRFAGDLTLAGNLPADEKRFRIAELEQRISEAGDPPPPQLATHVCTWLSELGYLYAVIGNLDQAETMFRNALEIEEKLGRLEDIASAYGNLGLIYQTRGNLDLAEAMHKKSLTIEEKLGRLEGMAPAYGNLGIVYARRGDLDQAETMLRKALAIDEKLGRLEGMAIRYGNLGAVYQERGDLDQAETMHRKSLAIEEKLGRREGMASDYANLGTVYEQRGDLGAAREYGTRSRDLFARIGMPHMVEEVQSWLDGLPGKGEAASSD